MAQAPTYQDLERVKAASKVQEDAAQQTAKTDAQVGQTLEDNKNPVLAKYMDRSNGLGVPTDSTKYSDLMVKAAMSGQVDPNTVLEDEKVLPEFKNMLYDNFKPPSGPEGLGTIQPTR